MNWNTRYDRFLSLSSWMNALIYGTPAAALLGFCWLTSVPEKFWIPLLLIYFVTAIAHMLGHGFQAVNMQVGVTADYILDELNKKKIGEV